MAELCELLPVKSCTWKKCCRCVECVLYKGAEELVKRSTEVIWRKTLCAIEGMKWMKVVHVACGVGYSLVGARALSTGGSISRATPQHFNTPGAGEMVNMK